MNNTVVELLQQLGSIGAAQGESATAQPAAATAAETAATGGRRDESAGNAAGEIDPAAVKADVAGFVKAAYGENPELAVQVMKTLFGQDYRQLGPMELENRLQLMGGLLTLLDKDERREGLINHVIERLQIGIDRLPKNVLDDLIIAGDKIEIWHDDAARVIAKYDPRLAAIIDSAKDRSAGRRKIRAPLRVDGRFSEQDYRQLREMFNISLREAAEIAHLMGGCFDDRGDFQKPLFEKNVDGFTNHPHRIFEILWIFLREALRRSDRLPLLNSLQLLKSKIKHPRQAVKIVVSDFILDPGEVSFPDRNGLMLAIQFLRDYNKEQSLDIEFTPEEVMLVDMGLNPDVRRYAAWKIDGEQRRFVEKMVTIRRKLVQSLDRQESDAPVWPTRFLLALEREAHILLALAGGKTATAVIRNAIQVYGNPAARVFSAKESPNHMKELLQHLGILIRGIGRVGRSSDLIMLDEILKRQQEFEHLSDEPRHTVRVGHIFKMIAPARQAVRDRLKIED